MAINKKQTYISVIATVLIIFFSFSYYISSTVSDGELRKEIYENVSLLLEKSRVNHEKIEISYGWNMKFIIPNFEIRSTTDQKPIVKIETVTVKAPLLSLFFPGFSIKHEFEGFELHTGEGLNEKINLQKLRERLTYKDLFGLKTFKLGNKHHVVFNNSVIINKRERFPVQFLKMRNFSWSRPIAYEIKHQINDNKLLPDLKADYSLIGEVDLGKSVEDKKLRTKSEIKINSFEVGKLIRIKSMSTGTIVLHIGQNEVFDGHLTTTGRVELDTRFFLKKGILNLLGMKLIIPVEDVAFAKELIPESNDLNKIEIVGEIKNIGTEEVTPQFEFNFSKPVASKIDDFSFLSNLSGKVEGGNLETLFTSTFTEGQFKGRFTAPIKNKKTGLLFSLDNNIDLDISMNEVDLKIMSLKRKSFYSLLKKFTEKSQLSDKFKVINIKIVKCQFGEELVSGGGKFLKTSESLKTENFKIQYGEGEFLSSIEIAKKYIEGSFKLKKFNLNGLASVANRGHLPIDGTFTGKLRGVYSKSDQFSHEFEIDIKGENGQIDKGQSIQSVGEAMEQFSPDFKISKNSNAFKNLHLKGRFANNKFIASRILYEDIKEELKVTGTADVMITDVKENNYIGEQSAFIVKLVDQKKTLWTKEDAINLPKELPLKIRRVNGEWVPDLLFTINKIKTNKK